MESEDLNEEGKLNFQALSKRIDPPREIEEELVNILKTRGLIKRKVRKPQTIWQVISIAASILFFIFGYTFANFRTTSLSIIDKDQYLLLLHQDEQFNPEQQRDLVGAYSKWLANLTVDGQKMSGERLTQEITWLGKQSTTTSVVRGQISGFFLLKADSYEEAYRISQSSPHLKYGGSIELRKIAKNK